MKFDFTTIIYSSRHRNHYINDAPLAVMESKSVAKSADQIKSILYIVVLKSPPKKHILQMCVFN